VQRGAFLILMTAFVTDATPAHADAGAPSTIVVEVSTFRNRNGLLGCQLYDTQNGFPDKWPTAANMQQHVAVAGSTTSCTFANMAPGTYAAAVIHDENSNNKLDTNFLGVPTEGYGISQNHTHALRRPTWDESKFVVAPQSVVTTRISLRY
jgi:uncharacterized protein (DUF2141 family)